MACRAINIEVNGNNENIRSPVRDEMFLEKQPQ
jgi:hypothetical protein